MGTGGGFSPPIGEKPLPGLPLSSTASLLIFLIGKFFL
jgi:hypothetical protein